PCCFAAAVTARYALRPRAAFRTRATAFFASFTNVTRLTVTRRPDMAPWDDRNMRNDPGSMSPGRAPRDAPAVPPGSGVSFVMPVLNEREYLPRAIASTLAQEVEGPLELVLALGPSTDGTTELARELAERDPRIVLVDNPAADIPVGLNRAIRASKHPTIVRVDAHSELSPGYTMRAIATL